MNIWIVGAYQENSPGQNRIEGFAKYWAKQHQVILLRPGTAEKPLSFETKEEKGFTVWRHAAMPQPFLQAITFALSLLRSFIHRPSKPDVIMASSPAILPCFTAFLMAKIYKVPFVLDVRENWIVYAERVMPSLKNTAVKLQPWLIKKSDLAITNCKTIASSLSLQGISKEDLAIVYNGISDSKLKKAQQAQDSLIKSEALKAFDLPENKKIVLYTGQFNATDDLDTIVDTAPILTDISPTLFVFAGTGPKRAALEQKAATNPNVCFIDLPEKENLWQLYALADICLLTASTEDMGELRANMFEIMAAGKPIVTSLKGESKSILEQAKCAAFINPADSGSLSRALDALLKNDAARLALGKNARTFVSYYFLHSKLAERYMNKIKTIVGFNKEENK